MEKAFRKYLECGVFAPRATRAEWPRRLRICATTSFPAYRCANGCCLSTDRAGLERLLRYCARPPFAMDRPKQRGADPVYRCGKGHTELLQSDKYSGELVLTPLELIDRICEVFPLICAHCGCQMRIIAFITFSVEIQKILEHLGVEPEAPRVTPARGPPLWDGFGAQVSQEMGEGLCRQIAFGAQCGDGGEFTGEIRLAAVNAWVF